MAVNRRLSRRQLLASGLAVGAGLLVPGASVASLSASDAQGDRDESTDLLIIGAGPFGLALAAYAQEHGIRHRVVGVPMGFWKANMPQGMYLRSTCDWSLDPLDVHSIDAYLDSIGKRCAGVEPLSRDFYLDYAGWFQDEKDIRSVADSVKFVATDGAELVTITEGGVRIRSRFVVLAVGFANFAHVPPELARLFPAGHYDHTCDLVEFERLRDRRVLVIGGRQSAFEWAALMREAGAEAVHLSYRHDTPSFTASDWSWVNPIVDRMPDDPGWYRRLSADEKQRIDQRFWAEGRLKLEPWLASRIARPNVHLHPRTRVTGADPVSRGMKVSLDDGNVLGIDHVVFATGYRVDLENVPFLAEGLRSQLRTEDGFPVLDEHFQASVPGLYVTSLAATRYFGSFLAFTVSVRAQAEIIGRHVSRQQRAAMSSRYLPAVAG